MISIPALFSPPLNPQIVAQRQKVDVITPIPPLKGAGASLRKIYNAKQFCQWAYPQKLLAVSFASSGVRNVEAVTSPCDDLSSTVDDTESNEEIIIDREGNELKISIEVSGEKTRAIFDAEFSQMVADAQPIPGFRRVKGGKTPDIPEDVLLQVLGPSKVYKRVIKKIINSTVSECVKKEGLAVSKDLKIEQSFEDLEDSFEPGEEFKFDAVLRLL